MTHHVRWRALVKTDYSDEMTSENGLLCKVLLWAMTYDQLNVSNLASLELLVRRLQMIEHKMRGKMSDASVDGLGQEDKIYLGAEISKGTVMFSPKLREYMADKLNEEAKVMKGQRLAREERALLSGRTPKKK